MKSCLPPEHLYQKLVTLHGHRCPMSTLGLRLAYAFIEEYGSSSKTLFRYYSADCAADGIRLGLKRLSPEAQFEVVKEQSNRLTRIDSDGTKTGITISKAAMDIAWQFRSFCENTTEDKTGHQFWKMRESLLETTLSRLKSTDASTLFSESNPER